jgi:transposase-like protein
MVIMINCAYCERPHSFVQRDFKIALRSLEMFAFNCTACGSTTSVELSTKRKRQGPGYKALVAQARSSGA